MKEKAKNDTENIRWQGEFIRFRQTEWNVQTVDGEDRCTQHHQGFMKMIFTLLTRREKQDIASIDGLCEALPLTETMRRSVRLE